MSQPHQAQSARQGRPSGSATAAGRLGPIIPDGRLRPLSPAQAARYHRNVLVPEVGEKGQQRIRAARVLVLGAGALGCPAISYLAAAGVGRLGIVDDDVVEISNLQRQVLYTTDQVGVPKAEAAAQAVRALNPDVEVVACPQALTPQTVAEVLAGWDVVVDGTDNFATRYLVGDACAVLGVPLVHGSVLRSHGQVTVLAPSLGGPCYRCLHPVPPEPGAVPSCAEAGVLGVLPGMVGAAQATEALKLVVGGAHPLLGRLALLDAWAGTTSQLTFQPSPTCPVCGPEASITSLDDLPDYAVACGARTPGVLSLLRPAAGQERPAAGAGRAGAAGGGAEQEPACPGTGGPSSSGSPADGWPDGQISAEELRSRLAGGIVPGRDLTVLDVREPEEVTAGMIGGGLPIPLGQVLARRGELDPSLPTVVVCAAGVRSARAIQALQAAGYTGRLINLVGGMHAWEASR